MSRLGEEAKPPTNGHFRIGSNIKTFTATVMLQLVAEGRIGLDEPAVDYLPEFGLDRRITVRMLLQHTSGVFNFTCEYYEDGTVMPGIPWQGQEWVDNRFKTYLRRSWYGWHCQSRCDSSRERTGAIPTPTTYWPGC
ncbi:beta-lactamase family protein [Paenibacillus lautus]|nr:beta-lactamase family protein [Paenibacillus lautus]